MSAEEAHFVDMIIAGHGPGAVCRRDPGEQGPLVVSVGDESWIVDAQEKKVYKVDDG